MKLKIIYFLIFISLINSFNNEILLEDNLKGFKKFDDAFNKITNIEEKIVANHRKSSESLSESTIEDGLVAYLSMDEGKGILAFDATNNNHSGIINGPKWTTGIFGSALKFNGISDYVRVEDGLEIGNNELSICAWVRYNSISPGWSNPIITQDRRGLTLQLTTLDQKIIWYRFGVEEDVIGKQAIELNTWIFVVATNNGTHNLLYINGILEDVKIGSFDPFQTVPLLIGRSSLDYSESRFFNGKIDEVRVYNRSLNLKDISNLYDNPGGIIMDSDQDKIPDNYEIEMGLDPYVNDAQDDFDGDSMPNLWEYLMGLNASKDDANEDLDQDGLTNIEEYLTGSSARYPDTDFDGMHDLWEKQMGLNITKDDTNEDPDGDWITNYWEYQGKTNPNDFWSVPIFYTEFPFLAISFVHVIFAGIIVLSGFTGGFGGKYFKNYQIKKILEQTGAPDYEIAKKMEEGGFTDFESYKKALEMDITNSEDFKLTLELKEQEYRENQEN